MTANIPLWQQAQIYALQVMDKNNSSLSGFSNRILSFLEGAESSETTRALIGQYLHTQANGVTGYTPDILNNATSLKEKIAQIIWRGMPRADDTTLLIDAPLKANIRATIQRVLEDINRLCIPHMTESNVLRHSALLNFDIKLSAKEDQDLAAAIHHLQDLGNDEVTRTMMAVSQETAAQRLQKAQQMIAILDASSEEITPAHRTTIETIYAAKMKPLVELDGAYRDMNTAISDYLVHTSGAPEALSQRALNHLDHELHGLGENSLTQFVGTITDWKALDINARVAALKAKSEWRTLFGSHSNDAEHFEQHLRSHLWYLRIEHLHDGLQLKKRAAFGMKQAEFEKTANDWREVGRRQILALDPTVQTDLDSLVNVYNTNPGLFHASEENATEHTHMATSLSHILQSLYPNTFGPWMPQNGHIPEVVATMMTRNALLARTYYGAENPFREEHHTGGKTALHALHRVGEGIQGAAEWTAPKLQKFASVLDSATKWAGGKVGQLLKWTGKKIGDTILSTPDKWIGGAAGNLWKKGFFGKIGATIISIPRVISKPASWAGYIITNGTEKSVDGVGDLYGWTNEQLKNVSKDAEGNARIENLFDLVRAAATGSLWAVGAGTDIAAREGWDRLKTAEKSELVEALSGNLHADELNNTLESIGIRQNMMVTTPRLFDEDGVAPQRRLNKGKHQWPDARINDAHDAFMKRLKKIRDDLKSTREDAATTSETKKALKPIVDQLTTLIDNTKSYEQLKHKDQALEALRSALTQIQASIGAAATGAGGAATGMILDLDTSITRTNDDITSIDTQIAAANAIPTGLGGGTGANITVPRGDTTGLAKAQSDLITKRDALTEARSTLIRLLGAGIDSATERLQQADEIRRARIAARTASAIAGADHASIVAAVNAEFGGGRPGHISAPGVLPDVPAAGTPLTVTEIETQLETHFTRQMDALENTISSWNAV